MIRIEPSSLDGDDITHHLYQALQTRNKAIEAVDDGEDHIKIDLSNAQWFAPTFLVPISVLYRRLTTNDISVEFIYPKKRQLRIYLNQINFPEGDQDPSTEYSNHLPLYLMSAEDDESSPKSVSSKLHDLVKKHLLDEVEGGINAIQYPISESINNVEQHSELQWGAALVQYYPTKEYLDVCVVDDGVTIPGELEEFGINFNNDSEALKKALIERVSTRPDAERQQGYGLYTTSNMVCDGLHGELILSSRDATIIRGSTGKGSAPPDETREVMTDFRWPGTIFGVRMGLPDEEFDFLSYLTE